MSIGDRLKLVEEFPQPPYWSAVSDELAELLGLLCADGYVARGEDNVCFTNNDPELRTRVAELWSRCFMKASKEWLGRSGFDPDADGSGN